MRPGFIPQSKCVFTIIFFSVLSSLLFNSAQATTLGYTTVGSQTADFSNYLVGNTCTANATFSAAGIYVYLTGIQGWNYPGFASVYNVDNTTGYPTTRIQSSNTITLVTDGWQFFPFSSPVNITSGQGYFIGLQMTNNYNMYYSFVSSGEYIFYDYLGSMSPPANLTGYTSEWQQAVISMYLSDTAPPTATPTITDTPTFTSTVTRTPTFTVTPTATPTYTCSPTYTASPTYTSTPSYTPTYSCTPTPSATFTTTFSPTITLTTTATPTITQTVVPSPTPTITPFTTDPNLIVSYPSPAKGPQAWFSFYLAGAGRVQIHIYNVAGENVANLSETYAARGRKNKSWDIRSVASGIYLYRITVEDTSGSRNSDLKKMVVVR
jgi:hypothetical protein